MVKLLTVLGLDTGYADLNSDFFPDARAGMEWDFSRPAPYIIKSPWFCDYLDAWLSEVGAVIDHAFVPMRGLFAAAESRRYVTSTTAASAPANAVPGGLWHTTDPRDQEVVLADRFYNLLHTLSQRDIPLTLLEFPRLARDAGYLYRKLQPVLAGISFQRFSEGFEQVVDPNLIHEFGPAVSALANLIG